jgi:CelD/BcsL family acetyltransferase involved in cellulose biosynthesis
LNAPFDRRTARAAVTCIDDTERFDASKQEWNALVERSLAPSVFLRHEWIDAAWAWIGTQTKMRILTVHRDGVLIGVCPMCIVIDRHRLGRVRKLAFIAVPDTQLCDVICAADDLSTVVAALADAIAGSRRDWDVVDLRYLRKASPAWRALAEALRQRGFACDEQSAGQNPCISLLATWEAFYAKRGRRLKKSNNLVANRLARAGTIDVAWTRETPALDALVHDLVSISASSWKQRTGLSLDNPGPNRFVRRLSELALRNGWLSVWILRLDGRPVAMEYQLAYRGSVHALRSDFDEGFAELSPGSHLNWKQLEGLFGAGLDRYYMGPGTNAYKLRWTDEGEAIVRMKVYNASVRGRILHVADSKVLPAARRIREWLASRAAKLASARSGAPVTDEQEKEA